MLIAHWMEESAARRRLGRRCVAAPDGLKNENFCRDPKYLNNLAVKHPAATHMTRLLALHACDAGDHPD